MHTKFDEFFGNTFLRASVICVLGILALFLLVETLSAAGAIGYSTATPTHTITVSGDGTAKAVPDVAKVTYTVSESAKSVAAAQTAATTKSNAALAAMKSEGIADKDVKTVSYNVSPQYSYTPCVPGVMCPNNGSVITGYQVSQSVQVTVRDTAKAGDVLQKLGTLEVQNVSGPDFTLDDPDATQAEARADAIAHAKHNAEVLAGQLGVHLGGVVSFSENGSTPTPYPMYAMGAGMAMDKATAPSLPVGQNETTSHVTVTYEIR
jgi:uncharacterized protein YggE